MSGFLSRGSELDSRLAELSKRSPGTCYTISEIATFCRASRDTIAHIERQALKKLRRELARRGLLEDFRHSCPGLRNGNGTASGKHKQAKRKGGV
jgi:hypothetical protein